MMLPSFSGKTYFVVHQEVWVEGTWWGLQRGPVAEQSQDAKAPHTSVVRNHWNPLSHLCWLHRLQSPLTAVVVLSKMQSLLVQQLFTAATDSPAELPHFDSAPII